MLAACVCVSMVMPIPMSASAVTWVCGDVNNDGSVSLSDVTSFNKYLNGMVDLVDYTKADTNADCVVDVVDRMILSNYITRVITSLPYTADGGGYASATTATTAVNSGMGYTVFNPNAAEGENEYAGSYYLDANPIQDNSKIMIGGFDTRYEDNELTGVVKIIVDGWCGTGFVVDTHTIATAAHCVFDKYDDGTFQNTGRELERILILDKNGNVQTEIPLTGIYQVHVPNAYISYSEDQHRSYDYALITVSEELDSDICLNLGIMTDGRIGLEDENGDGEEYVYCTGFPEMKYESLYNDGVDRHEKLTDKGYICSDADLWDPERRFCHNIDTSVGNSGGPVYIKTIDKSNSTETETKYYYTVIGIHIGEENIDEDEDPDINCGVQMTTDLLHFYKNNPNILWGE